MALNIILCMYKDNVFFSKFLCLGVFLLLIFTLNAGNVFAKAAINGYVNDYANIIDDSYEIELNYLLKSMRDSGKVEYAIVTVDALDNEPIESYAISIAQGVLGDKEKDNGLLLLVSLSDREYRFEVGSGAEAYLTDSIVGRIGREFLVPYFREGEYGLGILEASKSVASVVDFDTESVYYVSSDDTQFDSQLVIAEIVLSMIFLFMFFIVPIMLIMYRNKKKKKDKFLDAAIGAIILFGNRGGRGGFSGGGSFGGGGFSGGGFSGGGSSGHF